MADPNAESDLMTQRVRQFQDFLDADSNNVYEDKIRTMMEKGETRLLVDVADLRDADSKLCEQVLDSPSEFLPAFDKALYYICQNINAEYGKEFQSQFAVGFTGNFGGNHVTPRNLNASLVNKLVCVQGIVTKCSLVRPKVLKSVHFCEKTGELHQREYRDAASFGGLPTGSTYMTRDDDGNLLTTEYGLCEYADSQGLHLQEMPENTEVGQLPRSVEVLVANDLVDIAKPGDRIEIVGVYKPLPGRGDGATNGVFRTAIIGIAVRSLAKESTQSALTEGDIKNIREVSKNKEAFSLLSASLAPSICGHDYVKKGMLLQLLGGMEKNLANGTHIRGDINMLLVGDPSVAKSQILRYIMNTAPLAVSTTGRGSSGVGLTAAVTQDSETGERKLEAGAMVLADRGFVCIDEFDKMSDQDRVAIHEVMEQQTVTIAKAGIHTSLNARCSVVAAANPVYGSYNRSKKTTENIGLPDSLLSRFDLLFILLDSVDEDTDKMISDHVLRQHRYRGQAAEESTLLQQQGQENEGENEAEETPMFEKFNKNLHGTRGRSDKIYSQAFIKKYVRYCRKIKPRLSEEASNSIATLYAEIRGANDIASGALPITPRTLETLIRLATAHAKCRLSSLVEVSDVKKAHEVLTFALTNETPADQGGLDAGDDEEEEDDNEDGGDDSGDDDEGPGGKGGRKKGGGGKKRKGGSSRRRVKPSVESDDDSDEAEEEDASPRKKSTPAKGKQQQQQQAAAKQDKGGDDEPAAKRARGDGGSSSKEGGKVSVDVTGERFKDFKKNVAAFFDKVIKGDAAEGRRQELIEYVRKETGVKYSNIEATAFLAKMHADNDIMDQEDDNSVYKI